MKTLIASWRDHTLYGQFTALSSALLLCCWPGCSAANTTEDKNAATADTSQSREIERISVVSQRMPFRGDVPLSALPQAINVITSDTLNDQGLSDFQNTIDLASGISRQNTLGGLWDSFAIRGFAGDENLPGGYLINGYSAGRGYSGKRDTVNIQSIEVLKGPGSALYGRSEPGGTINIITKKPQFSPAGYVQLSAASYDHYRAEADYTNAINEQLAFRVNGAYEDNGSFRDTIHSKKWFFSPSVDYLINDRSKLSYELELLDQKIPFDRGVVIQDNHFKRANIQRFYGEPADGPMHVQASGHQLTLTHELGYSWQLLAGLGFRDSSLEGYSSEAELSSARQLLYLDGTTLSRQRRWRDYDAQDLSAKLEVSGALQALVTHHILLGVDGYHYQLDSLLKRWRVTPGDNRYSINIEHPRYGQTAPALSITNDDHEKQRATGIYLQDQLDLSARWKALLGMRFDHFEQRINSSLTDLSTHQTQNTLNPRAGLVFQADANVSLYVSYAEGFRPNTGTDVNGIAFDPENSKSWEIGTKFALFDNNVSGTLALFRAEKSNILAADPVNTGYTAALGKATSKGIELDLNAWLTDNTQLAIAYAYTDAVTANAIINADWGVNIPKGSPLVNIPKHKLNLTLTQDFALFGHSARAGINTTYVDQRLGDSVSPAYELPQYTLVRIFATQHLGQNWQVNASINNLLDKRYFVSSYAALWTQPGEPRTATISIKYNF
ncbi:TonB-dependent siderophore receptor [Shewanella dokdonensis]|uniref:TonB-dependent siderophore receptor n=1 Tax=Shewanella dokdonensis TaxID=712036 RepID=UPI00200BFC72|nr:TonB-dependent siderophore receptor [Shewanella dokdonensis]